MSTLQRLPIICVFVDRKEDLRCAEIGFDKPEPVVQKFRTVFVNGNVWSISNNIDEVCRKNCETPYIHIPIIIFIPDTFIFVRNKLNAIKP